VIDFAQWLTDGPAVGDVTTLTQYGVLGIVASLLVWFAKSAHQRERDRADRLEEENRRLNAIILDRVFPAMAAATQAAKESAELLNAAQREHQRLQPERRSRPEGR
jgi:hypothetical protein